MTQDSMSLTPTKLTAETPSRFPATGEPLRVAVIGCGAVAEQFHLPVLAGHEHVQLVALVDRDLQRARTLATGYKVSTVAADIAELPLGSFDAVVVATPPFHHASCSIELLERGVHVLVEKPMATCHSDACRMVDAADRGSAILSVGLFRRLLPCLQVLKAALDSGVLGRPLRFDLEGGAVYGWQAATLGNMRKDLAGGGVLMDMGPHFFDQLLHVFGGVGEVLEYRDNCLGGIESDCVIQLRLWHQGEPVLGRVELSRTRNLANLLTVACERGRLEILPGERYRIDVRPHGIEVCDPRDGRPRELRVQAGWRDEPETDWYETFRAQIDDWVDAIRERRTPRLSGRSALASLELIESCYRIRQPLSEPWMVPLALPFRAADRVPVADKRSAMRRVLITGATGFIGCRAAEILSARSGWQLRALVHRPASASRLARLPVELVQADLRSPAELLRVVADCDAVVHCAIGTEYGNDRAIFEVTVGGTRNLLEAARAEGVSRFVHISSIGVHGDGVQGIIDESTPVRPGRRDTYGQSKAQAEGLVLRAAKKGLSAIVLRPTCVYGPFGATFITRPVEYLVRNALVLAGSADTSSNTVFVDNLVEAIVLALEAPAELTGEVFTINDGEPLTWGEFYGYFAEALGARIRTEDCPPNEVESQPGWLRAWYEGVRDVATSEEFKALGRKALDTNPLGRWPRALIDGSPRFRGWLRRRLKMDSAAVYVRPRLETEDVLRITPRHASASIAKAQRLLGYGPTVGREQAFRRTLDWLRYSRIVP